MLVQDMSERMLDFLLDNNELSVLDGEVDGLECSIPGEIQPAFFVTRLACLVRFG